MKPRNKPTKATKPTKEAKPMQVDPLEALGINAIAGTQSISPEFALVILAAITAAVAGPVSWITSTLGSVRVGGLNLLLPECPRLRRAVTFLLEPALGISRRLASNSAAYSSEALAYLEHGPFAGGLALKLSTSDSLNEVLARHQRAVRRPVGPQLGGDLGYRPDIHRVEALSYPDFLLINPRSREMLSRIDSCNGRMGLIADPQLGLERSGSEPHTGVTSLADLLAGMHTDRLGCTARPTSQLQARTIIHADEDALRFLHDYGQRLLGQLLLLTDSQPTEQQDNHLQAAQAFGRTYPSVLVQLLDLRRAGREPQLVLEPQAQAEFDRCLLQYNKDNDMSANDPGTSARALPTVILWAIGFLAHARPPVERPSDLSLVSTAFAVARSLLGQHLRRLMILRTATVAEQRRLAAERILSAIETKERMTFRQICRIFHAGPRSKIEPVVTAMLRARLLVQDQSGAYTAGPAVLDDVEESFIEIIRAAVEREEQPSKEGQAKKPQGKPVVNKISRIAKPPADTADTADSPTGPSAAIATN